MITSATLIAASVVSLSLFLCLIRLLRGPSMGDRVLALDTMTVNAIALIILLGIYGGTHLYFEGALLFAMLGFVSTVAFARFILRGDLIE
ncbi:K+/H+ antiporter subunit F [Palleronia caenipelagi]|uniref:K+/H+ antiporter subunit F n=1 Tax=Palleronia caenipelagi TaxID=2489174 RepID=A0A547Q8B7_9RHOB|nr:K+/H+ antiporter subunit F [Palleronia caenipelagi]TRD22624.1 K+/H+ antiporter subunit F [Palleronia caenipelagi]